MLLIATNDSEVQIPFIIVTHTEEGMIQNQHLVASDWIARQSLPSLGPPSFGESLTRLLQFCYLFTSQGIASNSEASGLIMRPLSSILCFTSNTYDIPSMHPQIAFF